ncbi:glycosyltransferase family 4 protein, partial [Candidatus Kaiserbacteria bacterium]|nr:glycosyltransferase family 4 protein [Candidatus Kaiserbacteria bacterium]
TIELGNRDKVMFTGQQHNPEDWMRAMDIFCLPSYANEGVPQAILQAMLTALPIVTTPVGAILDAVQDGESAMVVPPRDTVSLARAIGHQLDNPALAAQLGVEARHIANANFSHERMLDRMTGIFRTAMERG